MARTHKFVGATVPRHHATQVGADGIDSVTADGVSTFNNQVSGITFEALNQAAVAFWMAGEPSTGGDGIA